MWDFVGSVSVFFKNPTSVCPAESGAYAENVGFVGFYKEERGPVKSREVFRGGLALKKKPALASQSGLQLDTKRDTLRISLALTV